MATLKDIAEITGVSLMTVSRAINSPDMVKSELREEILKTAKQLKYSPHHGARSMATNRTGIIQILTGMETKDHYFLTLLSGIIEKLSECGYAIFVAGKNTFNYRCDGIIVMSLKSGDTDFFSKHINGPCVLFGKTWENVDYVDLDNEKGISSATRHLVELGHRNIGFIGIDLDEPYVKERFNGYRKTLQEYGIPFSEKLVTRCSSEKDDAKKASIELLKRSDISAVVCSNDLIAMGMFEAGREIGKKIPEDLSITGFDGIRLHELTDPKLTTMVQPVYEIGQKLSEILIERIKNPEAQRKEILFNATLLKADSTALYQKKAQK